MSIEDQDDVYLITHALAKDTLSRLRGVETTQVAFRRGLVKPGRICDYEIINGAMETEYVTIQTPLAKTAGERVEGLNNVVTINMLRAATPFAEGLLETFPRAEQGVISAGRDEEVGMNDNGGFLITIGYMKLPEITGKGTVIMANPILVTDSTMCSILNHILGNADVDLEKLFALSAVSAPDSLPRVDNEFPEAGLLTVTVDDYLDDDGYIVPGLGDADDHAFRTTQLGLVSSRPASPRLVTSRLAGGHNDHRPRFE